MNRRTLLYPRLLALVDYELLQLLLVTVCELGEVEIRSCSAGKGRVHDKKIADKILVLRWEFATEMRCK